MVKLTLIHRVRDGLPLAEGLDTDKDHEMYSYKSQAKVNMQADHAMKRSTEHSGLVPASAKTLSASASRRPAKQQIT
jgi:hypothetical protein